MSPIKTLIWILSDVLVFLVNAFANETALYRLTEKEFLFSHHVISKRLKFNEFLVLNGVFFWWNFTFIDQIVEMITFTKESGYEEYTEIKKD